MLNNEIYGIKILLDIVKGLINLVTLEFKLVIKFFNMNSNIFSTDEIEKKNERKVIVSLFFLCALAILMGIVITIIKTDFPSQWEFFLIYTAVSQSPVATLSAPCFVFIIYIALEVAAAFFLAKIIVKEISVDFKKVFIIELLSVFVGIFYGTVSMLIGSVFSYVIIISPKPALLQGNFTVIVSVFFDLLFIVLGAIKYLGFIRRKIKTELGLKDDVALKLFSSSFKIYTIVLYAFVILGNQFSANALLQFSSKALTEENRRMLDAKKNPIIITTNFCVLKNDEVVCAVTIIPQHYQDYTLYDNWEARVEKSKDRQGLTSIVVSAKWKLISNQSNLIPTIYLKSGKLMEVELVTSKDDACKLERNSVLSETAIFFQVSGRSDEYNLPRPLDIRMRPNNEEVFRYMLKVICNT